MSLLPYLEIEAPRHAPVNAAVIWLHGLGADGNDFAALVPELKLASSYGIRFVFPHAPSIPVTINNGYVMPAWYDIISFDTDREFNKDQLIASSDAIHALIDREIERGIESQRIILAGFSQGGAVAYQCALSYPEPLGGLLALSSYFATAKSVQISPANQHIPILICHGTNDPVLVEAMGQNSRSALQKLGFKPEYISYPMEHAVCQEEINDISHWFQRLLGT